MMMSFFGSSSSAALGTDDDYRETADEEDALLVKKDFASSSKSSSTFSRKWTKVLAGSGIAVVATSIALSSGGKPMGRPAPRPLGEGETLNESTAATKTIKLHTAWPRYTCWTSARIQRRGRRTWARESSSARNKTQSWRLIAGSK